MASAPADSIVEVTASTDVPTELSVVETGVEIGIELVAAGEIRPSVDMVELGPGWSWVVVLELKGEVVSSFHVVVRLLYGPCCSELMLIRPADPDCAATRLVTVARAP